MNRYQDLHREIAAYSGVGIILNTAGLETDKSSLRRMNRDYLQFFSSIKVSVLTAL